MTELQYSGYYDYNATTPVADSVIEKMSSVARKFSNASGKSALSAINKQLIAESRSNVADLLCCDPENITFVSGGTEANNWAIKGGLLGFVKNPGHIITSAIEHPSVLDTIKYMKDYFGFEVTYLTPDCHGKIKTEDVEKAIRPNTQLISLMYANNETGVIQPVKQVQILARSRNIKFHVDAVQVVGKMVVNLSELDADYVSFSGHKFYGPKGIGGLYVKDKSSLHPLIHGGGQETGMRSGTENLMAIVGIGQAAKTCLPEIERWNEKNNTFKKLLINKMLEQEFEVEFNGTTSFEGAISNTVNFSITGIRGEALAFLLEAKYGICVSIGSACSNNKKKDLSHVLESMGCSEQRIQSAIRVSFGLHTELADIDYFIDAISAAAKKLLSVSHSIKKAS